MVVVFCAVSNDHALAGIEALQSLGTSSTVLSPDQCAESCGAAVCGGRCLISLSIFLGKSNHVLVLCFTGRELMVKAPSWMRHGPCSLLFSAAGSPDA